MPTNELCHRCWPGNRLYQKVPNLLSTSAIVNKLVNCWWHKTSQASQFISLDLCVTESAFHRGCCAKQEDVVVLHPPAQCAKPPAEIKAKDTWELYTWSQNLLNQIKERETPEMKVGRKLGRFEGGQEAKPIAQNPGLDKTRAANYSQIWESVFQTAGVLTLHTERADWMT